MPPKSRGSRGNQAPAAAVDPRQQGLRAFNAGRFDNAIAAWTPLAKRDAAVAAALAEAYFRRALAHAGPDSPARCLADLRSAVALAPADIRYRYLLGLTLHKSGDLPGAVECYHAVLAADPQHLGASIVLGMAALEQNPQADVAEQPGLRPAARATLAPVQALLRGERPPPSGFARMDQLWQGLARIPVGNGAAAAELADDQPLPSKTAMAIRSFYRGVAAAQMGDMAGAQQNWRLAANGHFWRPWLFENLAAVLFEQLGAQIAAGEVEAAASTAEAAAGLPLNNPALAELTIHALDQGARAAAGAGNWPRAIELWEKARNVVAGVPGVGSPRPLLHNLALAYEVQEQWIVAAETWRAMLRTRPRKKKAEQAAQPPAAAPPSSASDLSDEQWAWVRKRVIACYKQAGEPGEAVTVFRQAIKADPNDLETRLQLVDALLNNEQEQAALNELQRILQIDPQHLDARLKMATIHKERGEIYAAEPILRAAFAEHPQREDVRRQLADTLLQRGTNMQAYMQYDAAIRAFEEGRQVAPDDYRFPLNMARVAIDRKQMGEARPLLDQTLALAGDKVQAYLDVVDCWVVASNLVEARKVVALAEAALPKSIELYLSLGLGIFTRLAPTPDLFGAPRRRQKIDAGWQALATDLLDKAVALRPDDPRICGQIAVELMGAAPDLAVHYAEQGVRIAPDEPMAHMTLGMAQGASNRTAEAKKTLSHAARLARKQGNAALAAQIEQLRQQVGSPFFSLSMQMGPMLGDLDDLDLEDLF